MINKRPIWLKLWVEAASKKEMICARDTSYDLDVTAEFVPIGLIGTTMMEVLTHDVNPLLKKGQSRSQPKYTFKL